MENKLKAVQSSFCQKCGKGRKNKGIKKKEGVQRMGENAFGNI